MKVNMATELSVARADATHDVLHDFGCNAAMDAVDLIDRFIDKLIAKGCRSVEGRRKQIIPFTEDEVTAILHSFYHHLFHAMEESHALLCEDIEDLDPLVGGEEQGSDEAVPTPKRAPRGNPDAELEAALRWGWAQGYARGCDSPVESHIYVEWLQMLSRCYNPADPGFQHEGAQGIRVADVWNPAEGGSFERFYSDMLPMWSTGEADEDEDTPALVPFEKKRTLG